MTYPFRRKKKEYIREITGFFRNVLETVNYPTTKTINSDTN